MMNPSPLFAGPTCFPVDQFVELASTATQHFNEKTRMATSISLEQPEIMPIGDQWHGDVEHDDENSTPCRGRSDGQRVVRGISTVRGGGVGGATQQRGKREPVRNKHRHGPPPPAGSPPPPLPSGPPPMRLIRRASCQETAAPR